MSKSLGKPTAETVKSHQVKARPEMGVAKATVTVASGKTIVNGHDVAEDNPEPSGEISFMTMTTNS